MVSYTFYPNLPKKLHRYICHICDILQLCNWLIFCVRCFQKKLTSVLWSDNMLSTPRCEGKQNENWEKWKAEGSHPDKILLETDLGNQLGASLTPRKRSANFTLKFKLIKLRPICERLSSYVHFQPKNSKQYFGILEFQKHYVSAGIWWIWLLWWTFRDNDDDQMWRVRKPSWRRGQPSTVQCLFLKISFDGQASSLLLIICWW